MAGWMLMPWWLLRLILPFVTHPTNSAPALKPVAEVVGVLRANIDSLEVSLNAVAAASGERTASARRDRTLVEFSNARRHYKRIEAFLELYAPAVAAAFNARRQEVDDDDAPPPSSIAPRGFPVLESLIFTMRAISTDSVRGAVRDMRGAIDGARSVATGIVPTESQLFEASRQEIIRIALLGITGFDTPVTHAAVLESADAIEAMRLLFRETRSRWPQSRARVERLDAALSHAETELRSSPAFDTFDRLRFISGTWRAAAFQLDSLRRELGVPLLQMPRPLRASSVTPFEANAFDVLAYAPHQTPEANRAQIALGQRLFFDARLSRDGTRSCATCHVPSQAFSDGRRTALALTGARAINRNTPTLVNAALQPVQFADGRAVSLEDQVLIVLASPSEMGSSVERAARIVNLTPLQLRQALSAYVRSLRAADSRVDLALRGNPGALSSEERSGANLFMGKAGCATCHVAPLFNGNVPPRFTTAEFEVIGVPASSVRGALVDSDSGRALVDHLPLHYRAFKVPTLRRVSATAPYMHNGAFTTIEQVIDFYDAGGGRGRGAQIANQTLSPDSLHLTPKEKHALVSFLKAL